MNERIKELAEQAEKYADANFKGEPFWTEAYESKFAELLIQQCMACSIWVGKNNTNTVEPIHTAYAINQRIKQFFGVEE